MCALFVKYRAQNSIICKRSRVISLKCWDIGHLLGLRPAVTPAEGPFVREIEANIVHRIVIAREILLGGV